MLNNIEDIHYIQFIKYTANHKKSTEKMVKVSELGGLALMKLFDTLVYASKANLNDYWLYTECSKLTKILLPCTETLYLTKTIKSNIFGESAIHSSYPYNLYLPLLKKI